MLYVCPHSCASAYDAQTVRSKDAQLSLVVYLCLSTENA